MSDSEEETLQQKQQRLNSRSVKTKLASDEVVINNIIVPKRMMFNQQKVPQNGVKLSYDHSLGFYQTPIRRNAYFISDDDLVYPNGKHLVCYDMMKKKQTFILKNMEDEEVSAMRFHYSRGSNRTLIAVSLKSSSESIPLVRIYYITKQFSYNFVHSHLNTNVDIIDMVFILKGKFLVTLAEVEEGQTYQLSLWNIEQEKLVNTQHVKGHFTEMENTLASSKFFSIIGPNQFKMFGYEITEKSMIDTKEVETYINDSMTLLSRGDKITCHCWIKEENTLVICTLFKIFIFKNNELRHAMDFDFPENELRTLLSEQIFEDPEIQDKVDNILYLIELGKPSANSTSQANIPQSLLNLYYNRKKMPGTAEQLGSIQEMNAPSVQEDEKSPSGAKNLETLADEEDLRQGLIDRDEEVWSKFQPIYISLMNQVLTHLEIKMNCICPQEHGFAIGLAGYGLLCIYKEKEGVYNLESSSKIQNRDVRSIHCISSSHDNSHIAVVAKIKRKFAAETSDMGDRNQNTILEAFIFNSSLVNAIKVSYKEPFEFLDEFGPHSQAITHMAICPTKSLLGTLSEDKTLKFWNYMSSDKQMFSFEFHMSQQAFDIHPMSIQCVVGFKEGIKIYFLLENDLEPCYENFSKSCKAVKYSEGGAYLAIGFVNQVHIICPFRLKTIKMLGGHSGNISQFLWKDRDRYLVSVCQNSSVFIWDSYNNWHQIVEHYISNKTHQYLSVDYDSELDILVCCCSDSTVKFFRNKGTEQFLNYETEGNIFTSVLISKRFKVCFFGCKDGSLKVFLWPFIRIGRSKFEYMHLAVHQSDILDIQVGYNNEHLVTCGKDGVVYFLNIKEIIRGKDIGVGDLMASLADKDEGEDIGKISNTFNLNEFALLSSKMELAMQEKVKSLDRDIQNTISAIDENNEQITESYNRRIRKIEEENQTVLKSRNIELASQMDERGSRQKKLDMKIKRLQNDLKEMIKEKEEHHRTVLLDLYSERDDINDDKGQYEKDRDIQINHINEEFERILEEIKDDYEVKKNKISQKSKLAMFNLKSDQMMFQEALRQAEEDYNQDLKVTVDRLQKNYEKVKSEGEILRSKNSKYEKDIEKNKERSSNLANLIRETENQNSQLNKEISHFDNKCEEMQGQLNEQENIINMKENMIKEFRNMNYHLQNYKSVYDYQVNTLKEEHEPLQEYVDNLEKHIRTMYNELLSEADSHRALQTNIEKLNVRIKQSNKHVVKKNKFLMLTKRRFENLEHKMALLLENMNRNPVFIQELTKLLQDQMEHVLTTEDSLKTANNTSVKKIMDDKKMHSLEKLSGIELQSIKEDLLRQRDLMSKRLYRRTQRNKVLEKERENVYGAIQEEGKMLINKCNMLRKEGLLLMYKIGLAKKEAEELTNEMRKNFTNQKKFFKSDDASRVNADNKKSKKKKLLPIEAYRNNSKKIRRPQPEATIEEKEEKLKSSQTLLKYLMKEADKLYRTADENQKKLDMYQVSEFLQKPLILHPPNIDFDSILEQGPQLRARR